MFAHSQHGASFQNTEVAGLCATLKFNLPVGSNYPINGVRFMFINTTICLVLRLYYRAAWVAKERRQPKVWVELDQTRCAPLKMKGHSAVFRWW